MKAFFGFDICLDFSSVSHLLDILPLRLLYIELPAYFNRAQSYSQDGVVLKKGWVTHPYIHVDWSSSRSLSSC